MMIKSKNLLVVLAGVLVVALGLIGYLFYSQSATSLKKQSSSDDTSSIEEDLNSTEINSVDSDLTNIEKQISQ